MICCVFATTNEESETDCTYHQSQFSAQLLLSSSDHGQSSSCCYLNFIIIFSTKQHQQLQLIIAIFHVTLLNLKEDCFTSNLATQNFNPTLGVFGTVVMSSHLFACHKVTHAFSRSQSDLLVLLEHEVLDLW